MADSPVVPTRTTTPLGAKLAPLWAVLAISIALNLALGGILVTRSTASTKVPATSAPSSALPPGMPSSSTARTRRRSWAT